MDLGPHTIQIFISLVVVLAVAGVALVCDLLKGNNDHLRELAVELKVRNEEAERRAQVAEKRSKRVPDLSATKPIIPAVSAPAAPQPKPVEAAPPAVEKKSAPMPAVAASAPDRSNRSRRGREMSPAVAAIAQAAAAIVNQDRPAMASAPANEEVAATTTAAPNVTINRKNWDSILKKTSRQQPGELIPFESIRDAAVPAGYHEAAILQRAVESNRNLHGLVVSIGTNSLNPARSSEVSEFLQTLLGPQDFACQSGADEYILIAHGDQGAAAQRRLSAIAEKLWDFQLRSIGGLSVQFSWGSSEARGERIGEAVASAIEQMQETRQSRRVNIAQAV